MERKGAAEDKRCKRISAQRPQTMPRAGTHTVWHCLMADVSYAHVSQPHRGGAKKISMHGSLLPHARLKALRNKLWHVILILPTLPQYDGGSGSTGPYFDRTVAEPGGLEAILKHRLMSDDYQRIELITGAVRRRHWTTEQKLQIIEESFQPGETVSSVARRRGVAPNLLYRWRRLMTEGGAAAVGSDEPVVGSSEVRRLEERVRELERMLGRKTMEVEIFREALAKSESKKPSLRLLSQPKDASR